MSRAFTEKLSKAAVILASVCGIALGLCGLNAGFLSLVSSKPAFQQWNGVFIVSGIVELAAATASLLGLVVIAVIAVVIAITNRNGKTGPFQ